MNRDEQNERDLIELSRWQRQAADRLGVPLPLGKGAPCPFGEANGLGNPKEPRT